MALAQKATVTSQVLQKSIAIQIIAFAILVATRQEHTKICGRVSIRHNNRFNRSEWDLVSCSDQLRPNAITVLFLAP
jgi:hypothetical protein